MMPFFAKPFLPPSRALPSNGLPPFPHTPLIASTPSPTCLPLTFVGSHLHQTTTISLLDVRQERDETLRAFIDHFSKAALRTPHLNQEMILQCMAPTLQPGPFANVYLHPPASMHELKLCAVDYVRMEEMQTLSKNFCNDYAPSTANPTPQPPRPDPRPREPRQPRFTRYAPLNVPRSHLLDEALHADLIPPPCKTTTPPTRT